MRRALTLIALFLVTTPAFADDAKEKVTYADHVLPLLRMRCGSCHNANDKKGGLIVDQYATLMEGGSSGTSIEPGDPGNS